MTLALKNVGFLLTCMLWLLQQNPLSWQFDGSKLFPADGMPTVSEAKSPIPSHLPSRQHECINYWHHLLVKKANYTEFVD